MSKKTIIIILSVIVAASTAAIELLSSCSTGTIFHRVTPADSVYYERHVDVRPGSLSRVYPFSSLHHDSCVEFHSFGTNDSTFHALSTLLPYGRNYDGFVYLMEMQKLTSQKTKGGEHRCVALARQCDSPAGSFKRSALSSLNLFGTTRETDRRSASIFLTFFSNFNTNIYV